ncbi:MAG: hypothetical protein ABIZ50_05435 [Solirubrobacterales bacterium]
MNEPGEDQSTSAGSPSAERVGDALRMAVERTLAATADSATETRQRAQGLLDDVVRRGNVAREQVAKRGEEASTRLADAINDLRTADREGLAEVLERLSALERRLAHLETRTGPESNPRVEGENSYGNPPEQRD